MISLIAVELPRRSSARRIGRPTIEGNTCCGKLELAYPALTNCKRGSVRRYWGKSVKRTRWSYPSTVVDDEGESRIHFNAKSVVACCDSLPVPATCSSVVFILNVLQSNSDTRTLLESISHQKWRRIRCHSSLRRLSRTRRPCSEFLHFRLSLAQQLLQGNAKELIDQIIRC